MTGFTEYMNMIIALMRIYRREMDTDIPFTLFRIPDQ